MGELEVDVGVLKAEVESLKEFRTEVSQDLKGIRNAQSGILGGIIIACVLLILNMAIGR